MRPQLFSLSAAAPWPKKPADQIGAIRDLVTKAPAAWSVEQVAGAFKGANKGDVEEILDSLAALGILAGYEAEGARRWKLTRRWRHQSSLHAP